MGQIVCETAAQCDAFAGAVEPLVVPAIVALVILATVVGLAIQAYLGGAVCLLVGHRWDPPAPWTGKELLFQPACARCGHEPDEVAIVESRGSAGT